MKPPLRDTEPDPPSPYDGVPAEEDLWFVPADPFQEEVGPPLPRSDRRDLLRAAEWRRAEASLAADLGRVAQRLGALDERVRRTPVGLRERLGVVEAAEFSWWAGDRVTPDRLSLWIALRLSGPQEDSLALTRAGWAARRLVSGPGPATGISAFLGRGPALDRALDWEAVDAASTGMHPITRAALVFHSWNLIIGDAGTAPIEAAVVAARLAAADGRSGSFLPLASGGSAALRPGGTPEERLARWYAGAEQASLAALRLLDQLEEWRDRAAEEISGLSGRTPSRLLDAFARWPLLSAPVAEAETGSSRAAVQRNIDRLAALGLIREVTGQERFRLWTARLQK
ncbi:hypothetical protein LAZ40_18125 [Cereibacter sphaeroides]|uniref:hypothetical protein n=1 Tax=Cereibacter sphaeroides TaxID=1063 RepID=UPI001F421651|nr:hypothetical protein [Cereibacter sphaeroides]MCE6960947.1 hypothetical protein [Cereibacter sphaeroides]MCE6969755.1 hypothetical protein [Cereibacter sphaeroides]MCE6975230.1 hypothetical protein [Cereibacter sphaeroides]